LDFLTPRWSQEVPFRCPLRLRDPLMGLRRADQRRLARPSLVARHGDGATATFTIAHRIAGGDWVQAIQPSPCALPCTQKPACGRPASRDVPTRSGPVPLSRPQPTRRRHRSAAWVDVCQGGLEPGAGRHTKVRSHQRTITELGPKASEPWSRPDESRARLDRRSSALGCRSGGPSGSAAWGGRSRTCPAPPSRE
jgi:hypothetical protein